MIKWDMRFLKLAEQIGSWSKDPSTKVGAVIVRGNRIVSSGYNGFPQKVYDDEERLNDRETKYELTLHAEVNAILFAKQCLKGCTIYVYPLPPCVRCATQIIQSGISRVVSLEPSEEVFNRWKDSLQLSADILHEAGVEVKSYKKLW